MPGFRSSSRRAVAVAVLCALPLVVRGADAAPPEPELRAPLNVTEAELDGLPPGDPRRGPVLVQLAVRRHADAGDALGHEQLGHELALTQGRAIGSSEAAAPVPVPSRSTPRTDALRAEVVALAERAMEEAPGAPDLPDALIVGGIDADRLGRAREALRLLGALIRRHPASAHVGDAWLALGEHHLRNGELTRARIAYEEADRRGRPAVRDWSASRMRELRARVGEGRAAEPRSAAQR